MYEFPIISLLLFALAGAIAYLFVSGFVWGAGYFPTPMKEIDSAGELIDPKPGETVFDLGCGFGRVVIRLAQTFPQAKFVGVEIDPLKIWWARLAVKRNGLEAQVRLVRGNALDVNLSPANAIFLFLSEDTPIMPKLQEKMRKEMRPGSKVISYVHRFKNWQPSMEKERLRVYTLP